MAIEWSEVVNGVSYHLNQYEGVCYVEDICDKSMIEVIIPDVINLNFSDDPSLSSFSGEYKVIWVVNNFASGCAVEIITLPATITRFEGDCFSSAASLKTIYYRGTEAQWNSIEGIETAGIAESVTIQFKQSAAIALMSLADEVRELSGTITPKSIDAMTSDIKEANTEIFKQAELLAQIIAVLESKTGGETVEERLGGDGQEFYTTAPSTLSFRSTAPLNELQDVQINGQTVDPTNYELEEGSTIVKLKHDYLSTLDTGKYELSVVSDSKTVKGDFTVAAPELNEYGFYYNQPYDVDISVNGGIPCGPAGESIEPLGRFILTSEGKTMYIDPYTVGMLSSDTCKEDDMYIIPTDHCELKGRFSSSGTKFIVSEIYAFDKTFYEEHECPIATTGEFYCDKNYAYTAEYTADTISSYLATPIVAPNFICIQPKTNINNIPVDHFDYLGFTMIATRPYTLPILPEVFYSNDCSILPHDPHLASISIPENITKLGETVGIETNSHLCEIRNYSSINISPVNQRTVVHNDPNSRLINKNDYIFFIDNLGTCWLLGYLGDETNLVLPEGPEGFTNYRIFDYAFEANNYIESVVIPDCCVSIGDSSFRWCKNLQKLVLPKCTFSFFNQSTFLYNSEGCVSAFSNCTALTEIVLNDTVAHWNSMYKDRWAKHSYNVPATYVQCSDGQVAL